MPNHPRARRQAPAHHRLTAALRPLRLVARLDITLVLALHHDSPSLSHRCSSAAALLPQLRVRPPALQLALALRQARSPLQSLARAPPPGHCARDVQALFATRDWRDTDAFILLNKGIFFYIWEMWEY